MLMPQVDKFLHHIHGLIRWEITPREMGLNCVVEQTGKPGARIVKFDADLDYRSVSAPKGAAALAEQPCNITI